MKKLTSAVLATFLVLATVSSAMACPKGTHPVGGTGSHHKGGSCR